MSAISRRNVVRSASALFALPFAGALLPAFAAEQVEAPAVSRAPKLRLNSAAPAVSLDLVNFIKEHSAKAVAASYRGKTADYTALGDQFHMLGKHLSQAGADKLVKAHCKKLLKAGKVPTIDSEAIAHAVSCVQTYAPSYSARDLSTTSLIQATPREMTEHLKKLKKHGLVKYCHQAARQLNAMGHSTHGQHAGLANPGDAGSYTLAAYDPSDSSHAARLVDICSLSQKQKYWACLGVVAAVGLVVLAGVVVACGTVALAACFAGAGNAFVFFAGFGVLTTAAIAACGIYLASSYHHDKRGPSAVFSAI